MEIEWHIDADDIARVKALLGELADNALVRERRAKNLAESKPAVDRDQFWRRMASIRPTSIQRSGPNTPVARFMGSDPFPLAYETLCGEQDFESFIAGAISKAGIRHSNRIARDLAANFRRLEEGEWDEALRQCNRLTVPVSRDVERDVANYIDSFMGFGPKQSRNLLQVLGLTRFEIPLDSRVTDWLNALGFPVLLSATALQDRHYYEFVSDGIQLLCEKCEVYPCIFDASVFALKDGDAWNDANLVY